MVSGVDFRSWPQTDEHPEIETGSQPQTGLACRKGLTARRKQPRLRSVPQPKPCLEHTNKSRTGSLRRCFSVKAPMLKNHRQTPSPNAIAKRHRQTPSLKCRRRNAIIETPRKNAANPGKDWRRLTRFPFSFQEQIQGPKNAPIARFFGLGCYQSRSETGEVFKAAVQQAARLRRLPGKGINAGAVSAVH